MKKTGQQTRFRDDLRRLLLFYALLPVLAAVLLLIVSLGYIPLQNVVRGTADDLQLAWDAFGQQWRDMEGELIALQNELDLSAFRSSVNYQAAFKSRIYQFINQSEIRPQFFLLDADESLIFSTQVNQGMRESLQNSFHWRLANNLPAAGGEVATAVTRADVGVATVSSVLLGCRLFDEAGGGAGYVYFAVGEDQMAAPFKQCTSDLIVTDRFDSVFLGTDSAFVGDFGKLRARLRDANGFTVLSEGLFYIRTLNTENGLLKIYAMSECGGIIRTLLLLAAVVLVFFIALTALILVSTDRVADQKTRIIDEIAAACHQVQQGDLTTELSISSHDEFQIISQAYNSMLKSMRELIRRSVDLGHETAVSKIKQLESQFHPHFLFNTLENIRFMIRIDPKAADKAMVALSSLLRYSIQSGGMMIPLCEDLNYIRSYMRILEMRFGDRLSYRIDVPAELEDFPVPKLIVQPIIENAAVYGMKRSDHLFISLSACLDGSSVVLRVTDNGPGIEPEMLRQLKACLTDVHAERGDHFGIMNVHERIRLIYGDQYGISIESQVGKGTTVLLHFPRDGARKGDLL